MAFTAASVLQAKILEDTKNLLHKISAKQLLHDPIPDHIRRFPAVSKLSKYPPSLGGYINFEIFIAQGDVPNHLLYEAKRQDVNEHILIKFVKVYSIELHNFCAQKGHAPKILGYEWLPGGWYGVAMELIKPSKLITRLASLTTYQDHWKGELIELMQSFHAEGLVHGDLRNVNIICKDDGHLMLVDFDWGGKDGEVSYPLWMLNSELLKGRKSDNLRITKEDDEWVLKKTLENISSVQVVV